MKMRTKARLEWWADATLILWVFLLSLSMMLGVVVPFQGEVIGGLGVTSVVLAVLSR